MGWERVELKDRQQQEAEDEMQCHWSLMLKELMFTSLKVCNLEVST